jgi:hypothetical protein
MPIVRTNYELVVPGRLGGPTYTDLLFYKRDLNPRIYRADGHGRLSLLDRPSLGYSWTHIIAGLFGGMHPADLFCYDSTSGFAAFYFRNASGHYQLKQASQWISGFTHVLRGRFGPPQSVDNLLFYNRTTGRTLLCRIELNRYLLETITAITDFEPGYRRIVQGNFLGSPSATDLFFFRRQDDGEGIGLFRTIDETGHVHQFGRPTRKLLGYDFVIPGNFLAGGTQELFCHTNKTGQSDLFRTDGAGGMSLHNEWNFGDRWSHIVPARLSDVSLTQLVFHDRSNGHVDQWTFDGNRWSKLQAPPTVAFTANPTVLDYNDVVAGRSLSTLRWRVQEAGRIELHASVGPDIGPVGEDESKPVAPRETTRYTLAAWNENPSPTTVAVTVTVENAPTMTGGGTQPRTIALSRENVPGNAPWHGVIDVIGHTATLVSLRNPNSDVTLRIPVAGFTVADCNDADASHVITLGPNGTTTTEQIAAIFGALAPAAREGAPLHVITCVAPDSIAPGRQILIVAYLQVS